MSRQEYEVTTKSVSPTGIVGRLRITRAASAQLEGALGKSSEYVMTPSPQVLATYQDFIARAITYAHRDQLNSSSYVGGQAVNGVGFAFGNLYRSVKATLGTNVRSSWINNTMYISFDYDLEYNRYGDTLDTGRDAGWIPIAPLIRWIRMKKGVLNVKVNTPKQILSFAIAISRKASKTAKPGLLPGWTSMAEGTSTARSYNAYHERNKKYYVGLLTKDIMNRFKEVNK